MKKLLIFLSVVFLIPEFAFPGELEKKYLQANEFYKNGQYDTAIILYETILASESIAPEVYFNLGNAYYKTKNLSEAILNYERAYKLKPNDERISFNLQLAQSMTIDKINVLPQFFVKRWVIRFIHIFPADIWADLSMVLFLFTLFFSGLYLFTKKIFLKKSGFWLGTIVLFFCLVSLMGAFYQKHSYLSHNEAIVMNPSVTIKSSPDEKGNDLFVIHEGTKVFVIDQLGEWQEIKIADGNRGWLKLSDIAII